MLKLIDTAIVTTFNEFLYPRHNKFILNCIDSLNKLFILLLNTAMFDEQFKRKYETSSNTVTLNSLVNLVQKDSADRPCALRGFF